MTLNSNIIIGAIVLILVIPISNVSAGGPRLDWPEDSTGEGKDCWVDGWDAGFAGKYDKDRADRCVLEDDEYNRAWNAACRDAWYTEDKCESLKNNPVDIEDYEVLQQENKTSCYYDGYEDGKADNPFNEDRASGCSEYGDRYRDGYQSGCQIDSTESSCELLIKGEKNYCPWHPDIAACVEFLHNATNKLPASTGICAGQGDPRPNVVCFQESSPEGYCLRHNDPTFCKTIGDLCDPDGFVRPEYPYCTELN